jgi:hypothetical protein
MNAFARVVLPVVTLLAMVGCGGSSSSDDCDKACSKVEQCAKALGTDIETLLGIPGVTSSNCATGCREQKTLCSDPSAFLACTKDLTCPASGPGAIDEARSAIDTCYGDGGCPTP